MKRIKKEATFECLRSVESVTFRDDDGCPKKEVASYVPAYETRLADHNVYSPEDKLYYGGLLVVFPKEYCRLASSNEFKGEYHKNQKGLVIFKATENGSKTLTIERSKRRNRFYDDEVIVKMEAEQGYLSGFYKNEHWKIK